MVAESFLPHMNGVTNSVVHVLAHLRRRGDEVTVIAPASAVRESTRQAPERCEGFPVVRVPSLPFPEYPKVRVAAGFVPRIRHLLEELRPDVVHLASPFVLGWRAIQAARSLGLPTVSVYQTEVPSYAARYRLPWAEELLWQHVDRIHLASTLTLVPSRFCKDQLRRRGIRRLKTWRRGVDLRRFSPGRRDEALRRELAPAGEKLIGFVGRLAAEKQVEDLAALDDLPGSRLVIIGNGPAEEQLRRRLPGAHFAGFRGGEDLGRHVASLDVFVHPGQAETFCQTIQEAMAAAVPVVAVGRGGPLDLVDEGRTGWLYRPGDLGRMRSAVEHLVGDDDARRRFAQNAAEAVQGRTWEAICHQLTGHYARAIDVNERILRIQAKDFIRQQAWLSGITDPFELR
ncbi:glycosyltransferase family 1 protein [Nesterenkonia suensis]